jgi:hypothetical protein
MCVSDSLRTPYLAVCDRWHCTENFMMQVWRKTRVLTPMQVKRQLGNVYNISTVFHYSCSATPVLYAVSLAHPMHRSSDRAARRNVEHYIYTVYQRTSETNASWKFMHTASKSEIPFLYLSYCRSSALKIRLPASDPPVTQWLASSFRFSS